MVKTNRENTDWFNSITGSSQPLHGSSRSSNKRNRILELHVLAEINKRLVRHLETWEKGTKLIFNHLNCIYPRIKVSMEIEDNQQVLLLKVLAYKKETTAEAISSIERKLP